MEDRHFMTRALELAAGQLGRVWPNPAVGCVIAADGVVVGEGATQVGGRPHAEVVALSHAGERARGATAYVSLEPCDHFGRTPPCSGALIDADIARVVVALIDPDPRVSGKGVARLRGSGIDVEVGCLGDVAEDQNAGFLSRIQRGRPLVAIGPQGLSSPLHYDALVCTRTGAGIPSGLKAGRQLHLELDWEPTGVEEALRRLAGEGLTRIVVPGDDALAMILRSSGTADRLETGR